MGSNQHSFTSKHADLTRSWRINQQTWGLYNQHISSCWLWTHIHYFQIPPLDSPRIETTSAKKWGLEEDLVGTCRWTSSIPKKTGWQTGSRESTWLSRCGQIGQFQIPTWDFRLSYIGYLWIFLDDFRRKPSTKIWKNIHDPAVSIHFMYTIKN